MAIIVLSGHKYSYTITRKLITSIRLRLLTPRSFSISAPHLVPQFVIDKFINEHSDWIISQSSKIVSKTKFDFKSLTILDQKYTILINNTSHDSVNIFEANKTIYLNSSINTSSHLKKILDKKLRPHALRLISSELSALKTLYPFEYQKVSIRNQSSRFGSCSSTGNLSFNWQIVLFPLPVFRHVLLHELTHTIHHDHSRRFWAQLAKFDPQFITHRYWLKKHASKFMVFS